MAEVKLTRRHVSVLAHLSRASGYTPALMLPSGNGRQGCATTTTLKELRAAGYLEYGKEATHSLYGYRITDLGRATLQENTNEL